MDISIQANGRLVLDDDRMRLRWSGTGLPESEEDWAQLETELSHVALRPALPFEEARAHIAAATPDAEGLYDIVLARGTPPEPPVHGALSWSRDYFVQGFEVDEHGRIDYRSRSVPPGAEAGDIVVTLSPAVEGTLGADLMGNRLRPERARRPKLKAGKGIRVEDGEEGVKHFIAERRGRVRMEGETVHVDDLLVIDGDVSMATGHLRHPGAIQINGDVEAGFIIEAEGDVLIKGLVQNADIRCGGNLVADGGIHGMGSGPILVTGSVHAKYLTECAVTAEGPVEVELEAVQATIHTRQDFMCKAGRVVGGEVVARRGIVVAQAGSDGGTLTRLVAGLDEEALRGYAASQAELGRLGETLSRVKSGLARAQLIRNSMNAAQREMLTELMFQQTEIETAVAEEKGRSDQFMIETQAYRNVEIRIQTAIYPETQLQLGDKVKRLVTDALAGPLVARHFDGQVMLRKAD